MNRIKYFLSLALLSFTLPTLASDALLSPEKTIKAMPPTTPKQGPNGSLWFTGQIKVSKQDFQSTVLAISGWAKSKQLTQLCEKIRQDIPDQTSMVDNRGRGNVMACLYRIDRTQKLMLVTMSSEKVGGSIYMLLSMHD